MLAYIIRRFLLILPTLFGIMVINFFVVQAAPGGPIEVMIARFRGTAVEATARIGGTSGGETQTSQGMRPDVGSGAGVTSKYRGARGIDPEFIRQLEKLYEFDKPPWERFVRMMKNYLVFNFVTSFFRDPAAFAALRYCIKKVLLALVEPHDPTASVCGVVHLHSRLGYHHFQPHGDREQ